MSTKYFNDNEQLVDIAGKAAMDAQLSTTSTNGVQNKIVTSAINEINTHLSDKIGVESVKTIVPSTDNTNAYFNYPSGYSQIDFVVLSIEAFNGVKLNVNPTWAQVDLYPDNGVVLCGTIPSEYKGKDLYIQYALIE